MRGGGGKKELGVGRGGWGCPVRRAIWGVQGEDFQQQLSVQQGMMAHVLV